MTRSRQNSRWARSKTSDFFKNRCEDRFFASEKNRSLQKLIIAERDTWVAKWTDFGRAVLTDKWAFISINYPKLLAIFLKKSMHWFPYETLRKIKRSIFCEQECWVIQKKRFWANELQEANERYLSELDLRNKSPRLKNYIKSTWVLHIPANDHI